MMGDTDQVVRNKSRLPKGSLIGRTQIVPSNPLKADPTRTIGLRKRFEKVFRRRFNRFKRKVFDLVVTEDVFGLKLINRNPFVENEDGNLLANMGGDNLFNVSKRSYPLGTETLSLKTKKGKYERSIERRSERDNRGANGGDVQSGIQSRLPIGTEKGVGDSFLPIGNSSLCSSDIDREITNAEDQYAYFDIPDFVLSDSVLDAILLDMDLDKTKQVVANTRWRFLTDSQKVNEFSRWLQQEIATGIVTTTAENVEQAYYQAFVEEGYRKGAGRAFDDVRKPALASTEKQLAFFQGTKDEFLRQSFAHPIAIDKVKLLTGRVFTDLRGVTEAMATTMTRTLAEGLVRGENPRTIARTLAKNIDTIGRHRANLIARTEIIRAHAEGQLDAMERLGVVEVGVMVEWSTAGDDRVCPRCQPMDGVVFKIKEARGLIPLHPQCRCAHIPANVGEDTKDQKRSKTEIEESIRQSVKAHLPKRTKRTMAQQKALTPFAGKTIAKKRPTGLFGDKPTPIVKPKPVPKKTVKLKPKPSAPTPQLPSPQVTSPPTKIKKPPSAVSPPKKVSKPTTLIESNLSQEETLELFKLRSSEEFLSDLGRKSLSDLEKKLGSSPVRIQVDKWKNLDSLEDIKSEMNKLFSIDLNTTGISVDEANRYGRVLNTVKRKLGTEQRAWMLGGEGKVELAIEDFVVDNQLANGVYKESQRKINMSRTLKSERAQFVDKPSVGVGNWVVDDSVSGTLRHEYGHHVHAKLIGNSDKEWALLFEKYKSREALSEYGVTNAKEFFAESFSAATHRSYKRAFIKLPKDVEEFFTKRLGMKFK